MKNLYGPLSQDIKLLYEDNMSTEI